MKDILENYEYMIKGAVLPPLSWLEQALNEYLETQALALEGMFPEVCCPESKYNDDFCCEYRKGITAGLQQAADYSRAQKITK